MILCKCCKQYQQTCFFVVEEQFKDICITCKSTKKCMRCRKTLNMDKFMKGEKELKSCCDCREKYAKTSKEWKEKNKDRISLYNKQYNDKNKGGKIVDIVYGKKVYGKEKTGWMRFETQREAARKLDLYPSSINKVIMGELNSTGDYTFKIEKEVYESKSKDWEKIKQENKIEENCKGKPSKQRILHEEKDGVNGKKCCTCQDWKPLVKYNYSKSRWDNLRVDCQDCLRKWRKENRKKLNEKHKEYEKNRKLTDPEFKLLKTLRSRLGNALRRKNVKKCTNTLELTGCTVKFLIRYIEQQFTEGMTWENHGEWHIDHILPCASFNLLDEEQQRECFHYTNLQPLWKIDNLKKGAKILS